MEETKTNGASAHHARLDPELLVDFGHQLRNQLNAIVGAAGLLSATATSSDQRELASVVLTGAEELAGLVDEVLDSPAIHSGDFELALHPFNLRASVEACLARVASSAVSMGVSLSFSAGADVPKVIVGDSRRLEHSLLHLAADRTRQGTIHVELSCEPNEGPLKLRFKVRDSGEAMPKRLLDAAWSDGLSSSDLEPGERLAALSLHTTRHLVEMMDGDLSIRRAGNGTALTEVDFAFLAEASDSEADQHMTLSGMQVLVVAADATERRVLAMQAELWGAPSTAAEPADAAKLVDAGQPFDLALVEHRKPAIDGLAVATELRSRRGRHELPIVLIVAGTIGPDEVMAADSGIVQATLAKPVAPQKLRDVMAQVGVRRAAPSIAPAVEEVAVVSLKVLVADDNSLNQNMLRRQITKLGHTVDVVSNGREAVSAVEQQPYDALLMDVLMPGMDGLQAAEEICRRWSRGARPRLIALTAMAGPGDEERCLKAGFDDYMSKPVHMDELAEALQAAAGFRAAPKTMG